MKESEINFKNAAYVERENQREKFRTHRLNGEVMKPRVPEYESSELAGSNALQVLLQRLPGRGR